MSEHDQPPTTITPGDVRFDTVSRVRVMAHAEGFLMVQRPGFRPEIMSADEWFALARNQPVDFGQVDGRER